MNKRIQFLIILWFSLATFSAQAQLHSIGVTGGYANTTVILQDRVGNEINSEANFVAGLQTSLRLTPHWFLELDLLYTQNGYRTSFFSLGEFDLDYNYLSVPLKISYRFGNKIQGFINLGVTQSILLNAKAIGPLFGPADELVDPNATFDLKPSTRNFDLSGMAGIGARYNFSRWAISLEGRFNRSFTNFDKLTGSNVEAFHQSLQVLLGVHYLLGKK
ncbi:hypothetical protein BKI52_28840 [marine bacterium AO1-C]|nr:hypothetical protein BKI52_28840 [marine bacterium AO1-C]